MIFRRLFAFNPRLALSAFAVGCAPKQQVVPPGTSARPTASTAASTYPLREPGAWASGYASTLPQNVRDEQHVYRFDFVLTSSDGTSPPTSTAFTLNLQEQDKGEMMVGKNVPLNVAPPGTLSPRQDVGMKIAAQWRASGDDLLLDVSTEMSAFESSSSIRKVSAKGSALAACGPRP